LLRPSRKDAQEVVTAMSVVSRKTSGSFMCHFLRMVSVVAGLKS